MRNMFRSFMRLFSSSGSSREVEEPAPVSFLPESEEAREETLDGRELGPEEENARYLSKIVNRSIRLSEIVTDQAKTGDFDAAIKTTRGIGNALFHDFALKEIAVAQLGKGYVSEAIETIRRIDDPENRAEVLKHFSTIQPVRNDTISDATLQAALAVIEEIRDNEKVSKDAWRTVMDIMEEENFTAAVQDAREISDPAWRNWALQEIATGQAKAKDFPAALNSASGIGKALFRSWAYRDIAVAQAEAGQIEAAMDTARRSARALFPPEWTRDLPWNHLRKTNPSTHLGIGQILQVPY